MSAINTNAINVDYPIPGKINTSQGFKDNFASIKNNLNIAAGEITNIQTAVIVKTPLANTTLNNDMGNTLISNAAIRNFRSTTYNLGGSLSEYVQIDVALGDVQYGTISGWTEFTFTGWGPTNTQSSVELQLTIDDPYAYIYFPPESVFSDNNSGITMVEHFYNDYGYPAITIPYGVSQINLLCSTLDSGNIIYVSPINRPRIGSQIQQHAPSPIGQPGDAAGVICVDPSIPPLTITNTYSNNQILTSNSTSHLYLEMPIVFTDFTFGGISPGNTYYVDTITSDTTFSITSSIGGAAITLADESGICYGNPVTNMYICTGTYDAVGVPVTAIATASDGNITLNTTTSLLPNAPIIFSNPLAYANVDTKANANIMANQTYYIQSISSPNITVSASRVDGVAGTSIQLLDWTSSNTSVAGNVIPVVSYNGSDIWKKIPSIMPPPIPRIIILASIGPVDWIFAAPITGSGGLQVLDQNFTDVMYDLSGVSTIIFKNIGGVIGDINLSAKTEILLTSINWSSIRIVTGNIYIWLNTLIIPPNLSGLREVDGYLTFMGCWRMTSAPNLSALVSVGGFIEFSDNSSMVTAPNFLSLVSAGGIWFGYNADMTTAPNFPALVSVGGTFHVTSSYNTNTPNLSALTSVGGDFELFLYGTSTDPLDLSALVSVGGYCNIYCPSIIGGLNFSALVSIGGPLTVTYHAFMTTFTFGPGLSSINGNCNFSNNAFDATSVDGILISLAALDGTAGTSSYNSRTITLTGASMSPPTVAGLAAKAVLEGRSNTVLVM